MEIEKVLWPGWETVRLIGRGSFGVVYEIERDILGEREKAALKVIRIPQNESDIQEMYGDGYDEESITNAFQAHLKSIVSEYSLMRKMNGSSNVVSCDDVRYVQHDDGIGWDIYIKMELLTPLIESLPAGISEDTVIKIARDICRALVLCRQFGIVHRDIKPQNIFVSPLGDYKLGDFGIAKTVEKTSGGTKIGTYKYMAPEVYNNRPYGAGADIYSLGLVLYWLLNERRAPFLPLPPEKLRAGMEEEARMRRFSGEALPAPAHGSAELQRIVLKACAFDPKDRYQTADEMLRDLNVLSGAEKLQDAPAAVSPVTPTAEETEDDRTVGAWTSPAAPQPEEDKTVGAWTAGGQPAPEEDKTVGVWTQTPETKKPEAKKPKATKPEHAPAPAPTPKKKKWWLAAVAAVVIAAAAIAVVLGGGTASESLSIPFSLEVGSIIRFGHYEQDGNTANGPEPIDWYVIAKDEDANMLLLFSMYGLDNVQYHGEDTAVTWAESDLHAWLNSKKGFFGTAFTKGEQGRIANTLCRTDAMMFAADITTGGADTLDKVFLLSADEFWDNNIDRNNEWRYNQPTAYALSKGAQLGEGDRYYYWLRTPGGGQDTVCSAGEATVLMNCIVNTQQLLRPAIWVTADAIDGAGPEQAMATHDQKLLGLDMTQKEFSEMSALLVEEAQSWTEETAPQTLDEFPILPQSLLSLFEDIKSAHSEIEIADSTMTWTTDLSQQVSGRLTGYVTTELGGQSFEYFDTQKEEWESLPFTLAGDQTYTTQIPANMMEKALASESDPRVTFNMYKTLKEWDETLTVLYFLGKGYVYAEPYVSLLVENQAYNICWSMYGGMIDIYIYPFSAGTIWDLTYDMESGQLVNLSK